MWIGYIYMLPNIYSYLIFWCIFNTILHIKRVYILLLQYLLYIPLYFFYISCLVFFSSWNSKIMEATHVFGLYHREVSNDENHNELMMNMMKGNHHSKDDYNEQSDISESSTSSSFVDSNISKESSSSDLLDDASSSSSSSSPQQSNGPLYEFSELMDQLPIKRGLSKFYQGKSQSFTSLAKVASLEDLAKKETAYQRKLKACRSYGGGLNNFRSYTLPKSAISKKTSKGSMSNLSCLSRKTSFIGSCRPPLNNVQSSF